MSAAPSRPLSSRPGLLILAGMFSLLVGAGLACSSTLPPAPTLTPSPIAWPTTPNPATPTSLPQDTGWLDLGPGLEQRTLRMIDSAGTVIETITVLRIEPTRYRFNVLYTPGAARTVQQWAADSGATITLNAGYFTAEYLATGLVVADGVRYGQSYDGFGGMLTIQDDAVQVRSLSEIPYAPDEPLLAAVQSFPVLIRPGGVLGFPEEDGIPARRTVIGQDRAGKIVILVCPQGALTLHQLASYLLASDLDLDTALNLDGGTSTGLSLTLGETHIEVPSYVPVPAVISVRPKPI